MRAARVAPEKAVFRPALPMRFLPGLYGAEMDEIKRKPIRKGVRFEVFKRDGFTCQYCGAHPPGVLLHVDHIVAVAEGGGNDMDNLVTACQPCNIGKGAKDLKLVPQSLKDKASEVAEREEQLLGYQAVMQAKRDRIDEETWRVLRVLFGEKTDSVRKDHYQSTKTFIERLGLMECLHAADIASGRASYFSDNKLFRYFCGVCWNKVREVESAQ